jgi:acyl carrier protein
MTPDAKTRWLLLLCGALAIQCACDRSPSGGSGAGAPPGVGGAVPDQKVESEVMRIVSEQMGVKPSELKRQTHLKNDLKADELDEVELVMELEDTFEMSISDEDFEKLHTIGQVVDYVGARRKDPAARQPPPADPVR